MGYPQNMLVPMGVEGINQDYFHTLPDAPGYTSGKIIIGDSRAGMPVISGICRAVSSALIKGEYRILSA